MAIQNGFEIQDFSIQVLRKDFGWFFEGFLDDGKSKMPMAIENG